MRPWLEDSARRLDQRRPGTLGTSTRSTSRIRPRCGRCRCWSTTVSAASVRAVRSLLRGIPCPGWRPAAEHPRRAAVGELHLGLDARGRAVRQLRGQAGERQLDAPRSRCTVKPRLRQGRRLGPVDPDAWADERSHACDDPLAGPLQAAAPGTLSGAAVQRVPRAALAAIVGFPECHVASPRGRVAPNGTIWSFVVYHRRLRGRAEVADPVHGRIGRTGRRALHGRPGVPARAADGRRPRGRRVRRDRGVPSVHWRIA